MDKTEEISDELWEIAKSHAMRMKRKHQDPRFKFLGGQFTVNVGIYGTFEIQVNADGKIMKIKTPQGAYLKPPPED